jgi:hypothetical protein
LLRYEILFYAKVLFASFEVHIGVISTPANHIPAWASQNVVILNVGILKCSKMYITSTTHLNMTSLSSWIVYSSQSTYQYLHGLFTAPNPPISVFMDCLQLPFHLSVSSWIVYSSQSTYKYLHGLFTAPNPPISIFMDCLQLPIHLSVSSWIVYSSHSTYQTFLTVISVHKGMHIFIFTDLDLKIKTS